MRHGRSQAGDEDRHEGRYDAPLTDVGRAQAARLAAQWVTSRVRFDSVT
ncbi:MAG TPA: histidine phosphatase family protein, partial [Pseudomonadota bacterium]|nr:histidine phosphatase family protein [Pseudomonadota bacterium]